MPMPPPMPRDCTKREHVARVERVVWESPQQDFCILLLADGQSAKGPAAAGDFTSGTVYRFLGRWVDDPKRGYQFHFSTHVVHGFAGKAGVTKYLTDLCSGIGPKTVDKLWSAYGAECVNKLRDEPHIVILETGLNPDVVQAAAEELRADKQYQHTKIDLNGLFNGRGFTGKLIAACIKKWGAKAAEVVRKNPYRLMNLPSAGFKRCDKLWLDLGHRPDALKRQVICTAQTILKDRVGHTWLAADDLAERLASQIPGANPRRAFIAGLRAKVLAKRRGEDGQLYLTTANRAYAERLIADSIRRLSAVPNVWPTDRVPVSAAEGDKLPSDHQHERLTLATAGPVGILVGSGGTGKTHVLAYLLREIIAEFGSSSVCLVAPTGKAAVRMTQAVKLAGVNSLSASTIHSKLIECGRLGMDGGDDDEMDGFNGGEEGGPTGLLDERFVIVDECSMIDTNLAAMLLSACPTGTHVLLLGDTGQLSPVGHGSPLRDLIAAGLPCGELTQTRRNAGQIVHAGVRIRCGEEFETCERIDLDATPPQNLRMIETRGEDDAVEVLEAVLKGMKMFHPVWGTQVIIARNKGGKLTRKPLNDRLQALLNADGRAVAGNPFRVGDKVICLKNCKQTEVEFIGDDDDASKAGPKNYATLYAVDRWTGHREPKQQRVANGEIGRVLAIDATEVIAVFSEREYAVRIHLSKKKDDERHADDVPGGDGDEGRGCNFDLAYAVTCHKMQGSQAPCVIVVGDPQGGGVCGRGWLYTAVSRPEKLGVLIGPRALWSKMAARQDVTRRKTFLSELLKEGAA